MFEPGIAEVDDGWYCIPGPHIYIDVHNRTHTPFKYLHLYIKNEKAIYAIGKQDSISPIRDVSREYLRSWRNSFPISLEQLLMNYLGISPNKSYNDWDEDFL